MYKPGSKENQIDLMADIFKIIAKHRDSDRVSPEDVITVLSGILATEISCQERADLIAPMAALSILQMVREHISGKAPIKDGVPIPTGPSVGGKN